METAGYSQKNAKQFHQAMRSRFHRSRNKFGMTADGYTIWMTADGYTIWMTVALPHILYFAITCNFAHFILY
ncbi:MAG: hypothetical protein IIT57_07890 [Treponema sp.]|nr:hypothetical protein [Treponema sp.]